MRHTRSSRFGADPVMQLLVGANPVSPTSLESVEVTAAFDQLGERIVSSRRDVARHSRSRLAVSLSFAAVALVAAAVAAGAMITTHTGLFPKSAGTENDTSEFLRTDAPDFAPLVRTLVQDIAFPPGYNRAAYIEHYLNEPVMKPDAQGVPNSVQAAGVRGTVGFFSLCAWRGYWLNAHATGDTAAETVGAAGLQQVASSDAVTKSDDWWPKYVALAQSEASGDATAPPELQRWYDVNCAGLASLGAPR